MTVDNLRKLLSIYKKALSDKLTIEEFRQSIQDARIELDKSFIQNGQNSADLEEYINELIELQNLKFSS